jgi:hypothetical protein
MTIEVDTAWLVQEETKAERRASVKPPAPAEAGHAKKKLPPPIPGAGKNAPPPMPGDRRSLRPPPRVTMEVRAEWLEDVTVARRTPAASEPPPSKRRDSKTPSIAPKAKKAPIPRGE